MNRRLKKNIREAFARETPDRRAQIVAACEGEGQLPAETQLPTETAKPAVSRARRGRVIRQLVAAVLCLVLFGAGLFVGYLIPETVTAPTTETRVYLDVNPSLELSLDIDNRVLSCTAANEDAKTVLQGLNLEGTELRTALSAIVGAMYVKGYLTTSDNSMLISVDTSDKNNASAFLSYITEQVNAVFADSDMTCSIIAQSVTADDALRNRAEENGVSVGKMHLVDKMMERIDWLTEEKASDLSAMSIKDLNLMYSMNPKHEKPEEDGKDELLSGNVGGYLTRDDALAAVLTEIHIDASAVERYEVYATPDHRDGGTHMMYFVTLRLKGNHAVYRYQVDCKTGEVSERRTGNGWENGNSLAGGNGYYPGGGVGPTGDDSKNPEEPENFEGR